MIRFRLCRFKIVSRSLKEVPVWNPLEFIRVDVWASGCLCETHKELRDEPKRATIGRERSLDCQNAVLCGPIGQTEVLLQTLAKVENQRERLGNLTKRI